MREKNQVIKKKKNDATNEILGVIKALISELAQTTEHNILNRLARIKKVRPEAVKPYFETAKEKGNIVAIYDKDSTEPVYRDANKLKYKFIVILKIVNFYCLEINVILI